MLGDDATMRTAAARLQNDRRLGTQCRGGACANPGVARWTLRPRAASQARATSPALPRPAGRIADLGNRNLGRRIGSRGAFARVRAQTEQTYVMVKPDGVQRGLVGEVISRFERKGYMLKALRIRMCEKSLAEEHYFELRDKPFFSKLVDYICSGPVVCMIWEGTDVVKASRKIIGATNPTEAEPGTIRGDLGVEVGRNIVHGSDSVENGAREIGLWFGADDPPVAWESAMTPWIKELT